MNDYKEFSDIIMKVGYKHDYRKVFTDFLDICLYCLSAQEKEAEYLKTIEKYSKEELQEISHAFAVMIIEMDNEGKGLVDVLGTFYENNLGNWRAGQYFTPEHICDFMAAITHCTREGKEQRVCDPSCGSGRMLMAYAKKDRHMYFHGADIAVECAKITAINMCLNGMLGQVAWMDSLAGTFYGAWEVRIHDKYFTPYIKEIEKEECMQYLSIITDFAKKTEEEKQKPKVSILKTPIKPENILSNDKQSEQGGQLFLF